MESARFNFVQRWTSPAATAHYYLASSHSCRLHCQGFSVESISLRRVKFRRVRPHEVGERHAGITSCSSSCLQFSHSTPFVVIPALQRGSKKCFSLPPDAQLEEALQDGEAHTGIEGAAEVQDGEDHAGIKGVEEVQDGEHHAGIEEVVPLESALEKDIQTVEASGIWQGFPERYKLILTTSLAFVICNMDKVNMSVAVIPMSHQLGWTASTSGLVQSSFFWGYAISQLPGGFLAGRYSGKTVLRAGVFVWSMATALVPITAPFLPGLLACRLLVGLGEGVSPSAATDLIARTMPVHERSRAVSFVFGGLNVGSVAGLLLAPAIIKLVGWEVVFYLFGILGILWCLGFGTSAIPEEMGGTSFRSKQSMSTGMSGNQISGDNRVGLHSTLSSESREQLKENSDTKSASFDISDKVIPWRAFFRDPAVWAMMYAHFCGNWGHYNLLSWFPTYFSEELNLDLTNSALVSLLPPLGSVAVAAVASSMADYLISKRVDITFVRKLCQSVSFLSPAFCMALVSLSPNLSPWLVAAVLTVGSSLSTFTLAGLFCTHQDISPKYASVLLGLTNSVGALPGVFGVPLTGYILDETHSWTLALFVPSIFFYLTGALIWNVFASSKPKDF